MNISLNNSINHSKKLSCSLCNNSINKMHFSIKQKYLEQSHNNRIDNISKTDINKNNPINLSLKPMTSSKIEFFTRPYIKQLSQYSFLTLKKKKDNNVSKYNDNKSMIKYFGTNNENDDKTNIYFNLIKTYYDENGIKFKPKEVDECNITKESEHPKIIGTKMKKKKLSVDNIELHNILNFEKENKTISNNCNIYYSEKEHNKHAQENNDDISKVTITHKKIIKKGKNNKINNINSKPKLFISSGELVYKNRLKQILTSPKTSKKSFSIIYKHNFNSPNYMINNKDGNTFIRVQKNPKIINKVEYKNRKNNSLINKQNIKLININAKNETEEKNIYDFMTYFNKKVNNHKEVPYSKIKNDNLFEEINYNISSNKNQDNKSKTIIFHKKKISDSFDEIKLIRKQLDLRNKSIENNFNNSIFKFPKLNLSSGTHIINNNTSFSRINTYDNNNNYLYKENINKSKISPKRLEKYFNQNKFNKNLLSYKTNNKKTPQTIEVIDIYNMTFKNNFKLTKNKTIDNNSNDTLKENKTNNYNDTNIKNHKNILNSYKNKNKPKKYKKLSQNISYNYDKQKETSILSINKYNNKKDNNKSINNNTNYSNTISSNHIKYIKNIFKQNPYIFSNKNMDFIKFKIKNKSNLNKTFINTFNNNNTYKNNNSKTNRLEKVRKYIIQRKTQRNNINNKINENNKNNNYNKKEFLSPVNKQNNKSCKISVTESPIKNIKIKIKNDNNAQIDIKTAYQKLSGEKDKKSNKKIYIIKRRIKD